jgi:acetoin utilization deacetylase AcuC-like enzyme
MPTALFTHAACLEHDTGRGHPESADRLRAVLAGLDGPEFAGLDRRVAPRASLDQLRLVHNASHVDALFAAVPAQGLAHADADTTLSPASGEAALRAAGAVCAAVDAVIAGDAVNAFCAVRPPGHHAEPDRAMGFCLFNNIAIGALHARHGHGLQRIAVVDFDVHHGNGTQAAFWNDVDLFYGSTHQWPLYPGTGSHEERGLGNILNLPLAPFSGSAEFRAAFSEALIPAVEDFEPDLVMISAGFDAHAADPLANLNLHENDFAWATEQLADVARRFAGNRLVSALEGGYDLAALKASARAHVLALMRQS